MAVEAKRGCGFRKLGGLYLICDGPGEPCARLPFQLDVCPCCGAGIKPTRGWTWIQPTKLFDKPETACSCPATCPTCFPNVVFGDDGRAGLLWVGEAFYKTPSDFIREGALQGFSRRISTLPKGYKVGWTWVFMAHRKAVPTMVKSEIFKEEPGFAPGIFLALRPNRIERIVKRSEYDHHLEMIAKFNEAGCDKKLYDVIPENDEVFWRFNRDIERGITLVAVPDDDPDHQTRNGKENGKSEEYEGI